MTSKKSLFILLAVIMVLALIFTACAPKAEAPAVEEEEVAEEAPAVKEEVAEEAPTVEEEVVEEPAMIEGPYELTIWTRFPEMEQTLNYVGEQYTKLHPDIDVTVTLFAQRALDEKIAIALPAGEGPDLVESDAISLFPYYELGNIIATSEGVKTFADEHIVPSVLAESVSDDGKLVATPFFIGIQMLFYNTDYFAEAGLEGPPETLEELIDYAQKLTVIDADGNITRAGLDLRLGGGGYGVAEKYWAMSMVPYGVSPVVQKDGGWVQGYDNEGGRAALQFYLDGLFKYKYDSPEVPSDAEGFGLGAGAMFQRESWVISYLAENAPDINYAVAPMVKGPNDWGTVYTASALGISDSCERLDIAEDFIKFTLSEEMQLALLDISGWLPARVDGDYSSIYAKSPAFQPFIDALASPDYHLYTYARIAPSLDIVGKMADYIVPTFTQPELVDDPDAVAQLVSDMAAQTNQILDDYDLLAK